MLRCFFCATVAVILFSSALLRGQTHVSSNFPIFELFENHQTGIGFANMVIDTGGLDPINYVYAYNGGGVAVGDLNNDGYDDIVFTSNQKGATVYRNKGGLKFEDQTRSSGIAFAGGWYTGVTLADINADGLLDIYLCRSGRDSLNRSNLLYINQGNFKFVERAAEFQLNDHRPSTHANFFDFDLDGDLDVYILNHPTEFENIYLFNAYTDTSLFHLGADRLLRNDGARFVDVTPQSGITPSFAFGLSASVADVDNDGYPDLYVANDFFSPDRLYINNKNGTFSDRTAQYLRQCPLFSMGSDFGDLNNDGFLDLMTVDMMPDNHVRMKSSIPTFPMEYVKRLHEIFQPKQYVVNVLNISDGGKFFSPAQEMAGVARTDWSWGVLLADFNNDGLNDIYTVNGTKRDYFNLDFNTLQRTVDHDMPYRHYPDSLLKHMPVTKLRNHLFLNEGNISFTDVAMHAGVHQPVISNGIALADLDNDGDLDLVQNNTDTLAFVYRNLTTDKGSGNYLRLKLYGPEKNRFSIGARAHCFSNGIVQLAEVRAVRGFQSCSETAIHFGLPKGLEPDSLHVQWPDGTRQVLYTPGVNKTIHLSFTEASVKPQSAVREKQWLAPSQVKGLMHQHREDNFSDFKRDRLLPFKLSNEGPGAVVFDMNNDGQDDIFIGGAYFGSKSQMYVQKDGEFTTLSEQPWHELNLEVTGALACDVNNDRFADLILTTGSNEMAADDESLHPYLFINEAGKGFRLAQWGLNALKGFVSSNPLAIDFNDDGLLDLIIFARLVPASYPEGGRSFLLQNMGDKFIDVSETAFPELLTLNRVTGACLADMNFDGQGDVVVASEWEPIKCFARSGNRFDRMSLGSDIDTKRGLWKSILAADLNSDGRVDLLVGNQGENSWLKATKSEPIRLFFGDFDANGSLETIVTHYINGQEGLLHDRNTLCEQMPGFRKKFHSYSDYAHNAMAKVLTKSTLANLRQYTVNFVSSCIIAHDGIDQFKVIDLPREIQSGPIYGWLVDSLAPNSGNRILAVGGSDADYYQTPPSVGRMGYVLDRTGNLQYRFIDGVRSGFVCPGLGRKVLKMNIAKNENYLVVTSNGTVVIFRPVQ